MPIRAEHFAVHRSKRTPTHTLSLDLDLSLRTLTRIPGAYREHFNAHIWAEHFAVRPHLPHHVHGKIYWDREGHAVQVRCLHAADGNHLCVVVCACVLVCVFVCVCVCACACV
jgi:hypothetical protein